MMTGAFENWDVDISTLGPLYPFVGWEGLMTFVGDICRAPANPMNGKMTCRNLGASSYPKRNITSSNSFPRHLPHAEYRPWIPEYSTSHGRFFDPCHEHGRSSVGLRYLFIYGSLLSGTGIPWIDGFLHRCCRELGRAWIAAVRLDLGSYPGAEPAPGSRLQGQLLFIQRQACTLLAILDRYEAFYPACPWRSEFLRTPVRVHLRRGRKDWAWAYLYNRGGLMARRSRDCGRYPEPANVRPAD